MGESNTTQFRPSFNPSLTIAGTDERLTNVAGVVCLRELDEKLGLTDWAVNRLEDGRDPRRVRHSFSSLLRAWTYTMAASSCDQLSVSRLADDPALMLAASDRKGSGVLCKAGRLASQATFSRFLGTLASATNLDVLGETLFESAARGIRASNDGKRLDEATLDIDSFPHKVHGQQPGAVYNGHYRAQCYHPLGVMVGETGHWLGLRLREGNVHTAHDAAPMLMPLIDKAREEIADKINVRGDAGFPSEHFLQELDDREVGYAFRIRTNKQLQEWGEIYAERPPGRPPTEPRLWTHDVEYQANTWEHGRRVVVVVQEKPGELYLHTFFLVTSFTKEEMSANDLLDFYRERALMENHIGEHQSVLRANLPSSNRPKTNIKHRPIQNHTEPIDAQSANAAALMLQGIAYNLANTLRGLIGKGMKIEGESGLHFKSVRRIFLAIAGRITTSARRLTLHISIPMQKHWHSLWNALAEIPPASAV